MKPFTALLFLGVAAALLASLPGLPASVAAIAAPASTTGVVIAQIYGGGGNTDATYTHDYILLFNASQATVDISTWSVQYASATGTTWQKTDLVGSIAPGQFYLIQEAQGSGGTTPLPTPDASGDIAMSAISGKVSLMRTQTTIIGTLPVMDVEDLVGFGSATLYEGSGPAPTLSNTTAAWRLHYGCTDTDQNFADF